MKASLKENFLKNKNMNDELFYGSLIEELNALVEDELSKSYEEINSELIDDCCLALESVYALLNGEELLPENVVSLNSVIRKYNLQKRKKVVASVACAAVAVFVIGMANISVNNGVIAEGNIFKTAVGKLEELISKDEFTTTTTEPSTEAELTTSEIIETTELTTTNEIKNIYIILPDGINKVYSNTDEIDLRNALVGVNYENGINEQVNINECEVKIATPKEDGQTKITVSYRGVESSVYVTVISPEKLNPKTLTSIYGTFETGYKVSEMKVFAVFSDGTESEINKSECVINSEEVIDVAETKYLITVEYNGCSFQFISEEKGVEQ